MNIIKQVNNQIPNEYRRKECRFWKRKFYIDQRAHIPRKNTEPLVKFALQYIKKIKREVICGDIGTGAGVIGISLALECPLVKKVFATDLYSGAIEVAKKNVKKYKLNNKIILKKGNLLNPIRNDKIDIMVVNLPHASKETFERKPYLMLEPKKGVLSGVTGQEIIEAFLMQLLRYKYLPKVLAIFLKISPNKTRETIKLILEHLPNASIEVRKDNKRKPRFLIIELQKSHF